MDIQNCVNDAIAAHANDFVMRHKNTNVMADFPPCKNMGWHKIYSIIKKFDDHNYLAENLTEPGSEPVLIKTKKITFQSTGVISYDVTFEHGGMTTITEDGFEKSIIVLKALDCKGPIQ